MKKRRSIRFKASDFCILILCLAVAGISLSLFWNDLNQIQTRLNEKPIASITFKKKTAQRKLSDRVIWDRLRQNSPLYNGDMLRTAPQAQAVVTFSDGNTLDISENTMLQVFYTDTGAAVTINGNTGGITADTSSGKNGMSLTSSDGSRIDLATGTAVSASAAGTGGTLSVQVDSGSAVITAKNGKTVKADAGEALSIAQDGTATQTSLAVTSPRQDAKFLNYTPDKKMTIPFIWKTEKGGYSSVHIETASDKEFRHSTGSWTRENIGHADIQLPSGTVYWRLIPQNGSTAADADIVTGKLTVLEAPVPVPVMPAAGTQFQYHIKQPYIRFVWKGNDAASAYQLEIADNPGMANPVIRRRTDMTSGTVTELEEGTWYWRVTPFYTMNNTGFASPSEVRTFTVFRKQELDAPEPAMPAQGAQIAAGQNITFSWKSSLEAVKYTLIVAKNKELTNPVLRTDTADNYYQFSADTSGYTPGTWYWAVSQTDSAGNVSPLSAFRDYSITEQKKAETELVYPADGYQIAEGLLSDIKFIWTAGNKNIQFQIAADKAFSSPAVSRTVEGNSVSGISLTPGTWYWKAGASEPRTFTVRSLLPGPELIAPADGSTLILDHRIKKTFTWNAVPGASFYTLTLKTDTDEPVILRHITETHAEISVAAPDTKQTYTWSVVSGSDETEHTTRLTGNTAESTFTVRRPLPVTLQSPADGAVLNGLDTLHTPVAFIWTSSDKTASETFILEKVLDDGRNIQIKELKTDGERTDIRRLAPGSYQWKVLASSAGGSSMSSRKPYSFTVTAPEKLPPAELTVPVPHAVIGPEYLRKNHTIQFTWQLVPGATEYTFTLYNAASPETKLIEKTFRKKQTSYTLDDISMLDIGTFVWQIDCRRYASDGFLEQTGTVSKRTFTIDIPRPGTVEVKDQGIQYGE